MKGHKKNGKFHPHKKSNSGLSSKELEKVECRQCGTKVVKRKLINGICEHCDLHNWEHQASGSTHIE